MNDVQRELPMYECHKKVHALKIAAIEVNKDLSAQIAPADDCFAAFTTNPGWAKRFEGSDVDPGYFVLYADGFASWSPSAAFEAGYTLVEEGDNPDFAKMNTIARVCHEVNRAYCQALGDDSQLPWEEAPAWQRESARMGVDLHLMGDFGPEASHIAWMKNKLDEGWVYGEVKDPEKKTHHCLVSFDELPREQQAKDFIFRAVVHALR